MTDTALDVFDDLEGGDVFEKTLPGYDWQPLQESGASGIGTRPPVYGDEREHKKKHVNMRSATSLGMNTTQRKASSDTRASDTSSISPRRRAATPEPLGRLSPVQKLTGLSSLGSVPAKPYREEDPHRHPARLDTLPCPLRIYKAANRYILPDLADLALRHIVENLTPQISFPLLLATQLYPEVYAAVKEYCLCNWLDITTSSDFKRCLHDLAAGAWGENVGQVRRNPT